MAARVDGEQGVGRHPGDQEGEGEGEHAEDGPEGEDAGAFGEAVREVGLLIAEQEVGGAEIDGGGFVEAVAEGEGDAVDGADEGVDGEDEVGWGSWRGEQQRVGDGVGCGADGEKVAAAGHSAVAAELLPVGEDAVAAAEVGDGEGEVAGAGGEVDVAAVPDLIEVEEAAEAQRLRVVELLPEGARAADLGPVTIVEGGRGEGGVVAGAEEPCAGEVEAIAKGVGVGGWERLAGVSARVAEMEVEVAVGVVLGLGFSGWWGRRRLGSGGVDRGGGWRVGRSLSGGWEEERAKPEQRQGKG